ncbi:Epidermal growth factor receptor substrate 15-like 1 [Cryptotermes secundus]|uniref:Epidermal growth factor receptor substrate 15-like 1 n=1 Tax=Cryptotermes secundus TaxID=105785 RepID=A0A2J7PSZ3_9NEOP|nr:Epidermal growth factor receptor substrate 15-like 1 [Cryptotermes secundus]
MAALPSPTQVDPSNQGSVGALDAARFLKKSGLSDVILSKVWDLSDPAGKGYLNKGGFFVALKLVSLAQTGKDVNMVNITADVPPPKMGDVPLVTAVHNSLISPPTINNSLLSSDWAVKPAEKAKYDQLFESLQPHNGMISGNKVKGVLMDSKLPVDTLGKIWDLADMDKDGMLDRHEFMVAMHLVYKALEKYTIPNTLPPELMPPSKRKDSVQAATLPGAVPVLPNLVMGIDGTKPAIPPLPVAPWIVTAEDKTKYDVLFQQTDIDKDGYVSGLEIKDVFLRSGVPQAVLAHIWTLCDIKQSGKLNSEQFALSMWLINQKLQGIDPPPSLTPEMVPPSFRTKPPVDGVIENNSAPYSNPELDMITKDIEELGREKHILETDIAQKEADIKIKNGEIKSLQSELDTLAATLKQLENQKGEAQKRLNDLKGQVDNLRQQAEEQEQSLKSQEDELSSKKQELEGLKQEEAKLEHQQKDSREQLDNLTKNLQDTQLQISQAKAKITHLQEQHRQMKDAVSTYEAAISSGDAATVSEASLHIKPEFRDPEYSRIAMVNGGSPVEHNKRFIGNEKDPFSGLNGPADSGGSDFGGEDMFHNDPFKSTKTSSPAADPFSSNDPFSAAFPPKSADMFTSDPFSSFGAPATNASSDPFDPFGDVVADRSASKTPVDMSGKDPFGCDPFATLQPASSGPPPRPESPSPALPPKKSKQPPPRPAPPRPLQQPTMRAAPLPPTPSPDPTAMSGGSASRDPFSNPGTQSDPFAADPFGGGGNSVTPTPAASQNDPFSSSSGAFADFADFDSKFSEAADDVSSQTVQATVKASATTKVSTQHRYAGLEFTEDPFRNYRYEDPFNISDPFSDEKDVKSSRATGAKLDAFGLETDSGLGSEFPTPTSKMNGGVSTDPFAAGVGLKVHTDIPPEDQQLAWAAAESLRLEEERRQRLEQEQADFEYALALSREEKKSKKEL